MTTKHITHNGKTQTMTAWARELGINLRSLQVRVRKHGIDVALSRERHEPTDGWSKCDYQAGQLYCTDKEAEKIKAAAEKRGLSLNKFVLLAALSVASAINGEP